MKTLKLVYFLIALSLGLVTLVPVMASAADTSTGLKLGANSNVTPTSAQVNVSASASLDAAGVKAQQRGDQEIDRRTQALTDLNTRIQAMQKVTDAFKQGISASITNEINTLGNLKTKIDADIDLATLKTDIQSITSSYRVFALVLPQGRIAAEADREVTIVSMMSTLGTKLQARMQAASQTNASSTSMKALSDMATKLQDAQAQAQAAVTASASLTPDNGDKTKMTSNTAALQQARTDLKTAQQDLLAARKDVETILKALPKLNATTSASSTTQTQ